ncbi:MAG: SpoIIE family protein phosphatase [Magnetococcus sp. DMHC-1]
MAVILVVEDDPVTQIYLEELLRQDGHRVVLASDGLEALACLDKNIFDLILMDIQMPTLDGYETVRRFKEGTQPEWFVPVIFLTSVETDQELVRCLECGGDDFIRKPANPIILRARIQAWLQRAELTNRLLMVRQDVENVILKMRRDDQFDPRGLRVLVTPLEKTNGDIVLSACRSDRVQYVMAGDFTGHGLSAAICGPLVADIFYRMTCRDCPPWDIISRMNEAIFNRLPVNMFLAAAFLELDRKHGTMRVWNAAFPTVVLIRSGRMIRSFPPSLPPLGIRLHLKDEGSSTHEHLAAADRVYLFSDGSVETRSVSGDFFGEERLVRFLEGIDTQGTGLESLLPVLAEFRSGKDAVDDVTVVDVSCSP